MAQAMAPVKQKEQSTEIIYPETDGEPMAETDTHRDQMTELLIQPLMEHFRDNPEVYVSGNLLLYYEEGNPQSCVAPDVFVVLGIPAGQRRIYKVWEEGKAPDVVIELTSASTRRKDLGEKRFLYEDLGVREYFLFDPLYEYLDPPLIGFRLQGGYYSPIPHVALPDKEWEMASEVLKLVLRTVNKQLRLYDPIGEEYLRSLGEAENRIEELEAELARLRAALRAQNGN